MKAYKLEVLVIDFERVGPDEIAALIEHNKYLNVHVKATHEADIGDWTDDHPLNKRDTCDAEYKRLFP